MVITERGCAKQVYQYQALERGKWKTITTIMEETYTSGCLKDSDWAEHLATDTEYCYCDHSRCNDDTLLAQGQEKEEEEEEEEKKKKEEEEKEEEEKEEEEEVSKEGRSGADSRH